MDTKLFLEWMGRLMERFDSQDKVLEAIDENTSTKDNETGINDEKLLDNQDLCQMLNVSKRTL